MLSPWVAEKDTIYMQKPVRISILRELAASRSKDSKQTTELNHSVNAEIEVFNLGSIFWRIRFDMRSTASCNYP